MGKVEKYVWIVGIGGTEVDGVRMHKFIGTEYQAKNHLVSLVKGDISNDAEAFEYGTTKISEVEVRKETRSFYAYGNYDDYHIDYEAYKLEDISEL